jgi:hypothetical protein
MFRNIYRKNPKEIIITGKPMVLSPEFSQSRRWAVIEMDLEDIHVERL